MSGGNGSFDIDMFRRVDFERRKSIVNADCLSEFFDGNAFFEVQSLTGREVFNAENRVKHNEAIESIVEKLSSVDWQAKVDAAMEALGISDNVTSAMVKMIAYVENGVCSINLTQSDVVKLADKFPGLFLSLFQEINELTMLGHVSSGKLKATGAIQE